MKLKLTMQVGSGAESRFYQKEVCVHAENIENGLQFICSDVTTAMVNCAWFNEQLEGELLLDNPSSKTHVD